MYVATAVVNVYVIMPRSVAYMKQTRNNVLREPMEVQNCKNISGYDKYL